MRVSLKLSKAGFFYTLITIFIGVSAVNTGNNLLYVSLSFLLSFMWLSGVFAKLNLKGLEVFFYPPKESYARRKTLLKIFLRKKGFFPSFLLTLKIRLSDSGKDLELTKKLPFFKKEKELLLEFIPERRGEVKISELEISSPFPVSFFRRFLKIKVSMSFLVFPEPKRCEFHKEGERRKGEDLSGIKEGVADFQGLSEFQAGTPRKFISWKTYAKWEELKRKLFSEEESPSFFIELKKLSPPHLEDKLSCATYLVLKAVEKGIPVGIKLDNKIIPPGSGEKQKLKILTLLAKYEESI